MLGNGRPIRFDVFEVDLHIGLAASYRLGAVWEVVIDKRKRNHSLSRIS